MPDVKARYNIYCGFDAASEHSLQSLLRVIAAQVPGLPSVENRMRPHLSLAVFDAEDKNWAEAAFRQLATDATPFTLYLETLAVFSGQRAVLYAKPAASAALASYYARAHATISSDRLVTAYRDPRQWHPHVTLAKGLDAQQCRLALAVARKSWSPLTASVIFLGLIDVQRPRVDLMGASL